MNCYIYTGDVKRNVIQTVHKIAWHHYDIIHNLLLHVHWGKCCRTCVPVGQRWGCGAWLDEGYEWTLAWTFCSLREDLSGQRWEESGSNRSQTPYLCVGGRGGQMRYKLMVNTQWLFPQRDRVKKILLHWISPRLRITDKWIWSSLKHNTLLWDWAILYIYLCPWWGACCTECTC